MALTEPILTKLRLAGRHFVKKIFIEFYPNLFRGNPWYCVTEGQKNEWTEQDWIGLQTRPSCTENAFFLKETAFIFVLHARHFSTHKEFLSFSITIKL